METLQHHEDDDLDVAIVERRIRRKYDFRILPLVTAIYLCGFLVRVNISNVQDQLMTKFQLTADSFGLLLIAFFIGYTLFEVPANLMLKRFTAPKWLSFILLSWGLFACLTAFSTSFPLLWLCRLFVGTLEAGIFPGILWYLSLWYKRSERGFRFSIFFTAALLSSSLAGLLAYFLLGLDGLYGFEGWQWVFFIEGLPSVLLAPIIYFNLPADPDRAEWLSDRERSIAANRLKVSHELDVEEDVCLLPEENMFPEISQAAPPSEIDEERKLDVFTEPTVWLFSFLYFCISMPMAAVSFFLPKMVQLLGFSFVVSNLVTVPLYMVAAAYVLLLSRSSDKNTERPFHIIFSTLVGLTGFLGLTILDPNTNVKVLFVFVQLAVIGSAGAVPLTGVWLTGVIPHDKPLLLAVGTGTMVTFGQLASIICPYVYSWLATPMADNKFDFKRVNLFMASIMSVSIVILLTIRHITRNKL